MGENWGVGIDTTQEGGEKGHLSNEEFRLLRYSFLIKVGKNCVSVSFSFSLGLFRTSAADYNATHLQP